MRSVHQHASFELSKTVLGQFFKFFIIKWFGGGSKSYPTRKKVEQNFWKKFLTRGQNGTRKRVGRSRVWRIPFFDRIQISNIIWFSPNNKDRILFSIEKIRILNTICYQENPNMNTNITIQSNYLNTEH